jgi:hypothetical protein
MVSRAIRLHELIRHDVTVEALVSKKIGGNGGWHFSIVWFRAGLVTYRTTASDKHYALLLDTLLGRLDEMGWRYPFSGNWSLHSCRRSARFCGAEQYTDTH